MPDWETGAWPRAEHLQRVFQVRSGSNLGTAFAIDVDGKQYLTSALHVIRESIDTAMLDIWRDSTWVPFVINVVGVDEAADLAVVALIERIVTAELTVDISGSGCVAGQEVFFLGYPLGIRGPSVGVGWPLPLIRRGIASNFYVGPPAGMYISGSANPGFSGGPVYFVHQKTGRATLTAIIIAALAYEVPVMDSQGIEVGRVSTDSNIVQSSYVDYVLQLIEKNPAGLSLS